MENASYPEGWCAETSALAHMQMAVQARACPGGVLGQGEGVLTPAVAVDSVCLNSGALNEGHVRQPKGDEQVFTLGQLLPSAFDL